MVNDPEIGVWMVYDGDGLAGVGRMAALFSSMAFSQTSRGTMPVQRWVVRFWRAISI